MKVMQLNQIRMLQPVSRLYYWDCARNSVYEEIRGNRIYRLPDDEGFWTLNLDIRTVHLKCVKVHSENLKGMIDSHMSRPKQKESFWSRHL